jgi:hypothetical protein
MLGLYSEESLALTEPQARGPLLVSSPLMLILYIRSQPSTPG